MKIASFTIPLALYVSLFASLSAADEIHIPDREHRQGMSYEEYKNFREKMRMRLEKSRVEGNGSASELTQHADEHPDRHREEDTYGKGYRSRILNDGHPDTKPEGRPDRGARVEKFNRGDMMRR